jgi:sugar/nucleoside kinase (ribokinase family)
MRLIPAHGVKTIDSTGAGDVFSASLAAFLAEGMSDGCSDVSTFSL